MILDKKLLISITARNVNYYKNKGYDVNVGDYKSIIIADINTNSLLKVKCECDICGKTNIISFRKYNENVTNNGKYVGYECKYYTYKITSNIKYGCDNPSMLESTKQKNKATCLLKYECENPMQNEFVKHKQLVNNNKKYGCGNVFQNQKIKDKIKRGYNDKYGVDYPSQVEAIHQKSLSSSFKIKYYKNTDLYYQGSYELDFLINYFDIFEIKRGLTFRYDNSIYYSDFYIESLNLIIEIKSTFYYNLNPDKILRKSSAVIESGYIFILILDKNYSEFENKYIIHE